MAADAEFDRARSEGWRTPRCVRPLTLISTRSSASHREEREERWNQENSETEGGVDKIAARAYYKVRALVAPSSQSPDQSWQSLKNSKGKGVKVGRAGGRDRSGWEEEE
jgi:hypothetical protein